MNLELCKNIWSSDLLDQTTIEFGKEAVYPVAWVEDFFS